MRGAEAIVRILKAEGVEQVFCFPFTPILDALAAGGIRPVTARQERVAENMADGFSRATNGERLGVVTVQQSAGAENGFSGIAQAYTDSSPILYLPGHPGSRLVGTPPTFDSAVNYRATTKMAELIPDVEVISGHMRRAFTALRSGRPRPVLVEIPLDVARAELDDDFAWTPVAPIRMGPDPQAVSDAIDLLLAAERPMVWAGQGTLYAGATAELTALAERLALPVTTTLLGKSAFDERHPLSLGTASFSTTAMVAEALVESDVILALGASLARDFTAPPIPGGKKFIHNTVDASDLNVGYRADLPLLGDARLVARALLDELARRGESRDRAPVEARIAGQRAEWAQRWRPKLTSEEVPINPYRVVAELMKAFDPSHTIVTHESGGSRDQLVPFYVAVNPRGYLGWGHSTQLGFGLGAAMGAKLAHPDKLVVNVMGDASFGMVGLDIETAVREKIPILTVVLNNAAMGNYEKNIPIASERYGTKFLTGNYAQVAAALGAHAERIEKPGELAGAFARAKGLTEEGTPVLLEVISSEEADIPYWHTFGLR